MVRWGKGHARLNGYLVHAYTASTLIFVALAVQFIWHEHFRLALVMMAVTILIDATDGVLARRCRVKETAASIDGSRLDDIIDFLSYVFVPMLFALRAEILLTPAVPTVALVMIASAFGFSRVTAKLGAEGFFVGFPSYWNIVVFYLYLLGTPPLLNTLALVFLALMVLVPLRYLYLSRLPHYRTLHCALGTLWGGLCLLTLGLEPGSLRFVLLVASLGYPLYYTLYSWHLDLETRQRKALAE